jgi:hypothetical protein
VHVNRERSVDELKLKLEAVLKVGQAPAVRLHPPLRPLAGGGGG